MKLSGDSIAWTVRGPDEADLASHASVARARGPERQDVLRLTPLEGSLEALESLTHRVEPGRAYLASATVRTALDRAHVQMVLHWLDEQDRPISRETSDPSFAYHDFAPLEIWTIAPPNASQAQISVQLMRDRDGAAGEALVVPSMVFPSIVLEAIPEEPTSLFTPDQPVRYRIIARGRPPEAEEVTLSYSVANYANVVLHEGSTSLPSAGEDGEVALEFPALPPGYYELSAHTSDSGLAPARLWCSFGCLAPLEFEPPADYAIACDAGLSWTYYTPEQVALAARICQRLGLRSLRDRLSWGQVNPEPGVFNWGRYADTAQVQRQAGLDVYQMFSDAPAWAQVPTEDGQTRGSYPPRDPRYVYEMASRLAQDLGDKVSFLELWNEPDIFFYTGHPWDYASIAKAGALGVKDADPKLGVLLGSRCSKIDFWRRTLENGVGPFVDIWNQHSYGQPEDLFALIQEDRDLMAEFGLALPIWMTEMGRRATPSPDGSYDEAERAQVSYLIRAYACGLAAGLDRFYYFYLQEFLEYGLHLWGLLRRDLTPKPAFIALGNLIRQLQEPEPVGALREGDVYCMVFRRSDGRHVGVAWTTATGTASLEVQVESGARVLDAMGRKLLDLRAGSATVKLSDQPLFIHGVRADAMTLQPPAERRRHTVEPRPAPETLRVWLGAETRPGQPWPDPDTVNEQKLALVCEEGQSEAIRLWVHNYSESEAAVRIELETPQGWELAESPQSQFSVTANGTQSARLSMVPRQLQPGQEYAIGATLFVGDQARDRVRVYYQAREAPES